MVVYSLFIHSSSTVLCLLGWRILRRWASLIILSFIYYFYVRSYHPNFLITNVYVYMPLQMNICNYIML